MTISEHWLAPMLAPRSVALVGASPKPGSVGQQMLSHLRDGGFAGDIHFVNPTYTSIEDRPCHPSLLSIGCAPDLVLMGIAGAKLERAFDDALAKGAKGIVIFADCYLDDDDDPPLVERLRNKASEAGVPVCGGNGVGFFNFDTNTIATFSTRSNAEHIPGNVTLIAHSGSVVTALTMHRSVNIYNLVVSPGQEINGTVADYMRFALTQPSTSVLALFLEAIRDPNAFVDALAEAHRKNVPVVVLKTGRTTESARLSVSHTGAVSGNDEAFDAVVERYGAIRVSSVDELEATAMLLAQRRVPGCGGLAATFDSGGLRALLIDRAAALGVPLAVITERTRESLQRYLRHGMEAVNPLDAWAERHDVAGVFEHCLDALANDENAAIVGHFYEMRDRFPYAPFFETLATEMPSRTEKPFFVASSYAGVRNDETAARLIKHGVPVINGSETALLAVRNVLAYRDHRGLPVDAIPPAPPSDVVARWRTHLGSGGPCENGEALLIDFSIPTVPVEIVECAEDAVKTTRRLGYPVVLKTAMPGIHHKTDVGGVAIDLRSDDDVRTTYARFATSFGPRASVSPMVGPGVEFAFGLTHDDQFGPVVMISAGGTLVEYSEDRVWALPPFGITEARRLTGRLKAAGLLGGIRGGPAADVTALVRALSNFSVMAAALSDVLDEVDVNPIIVKSDGCVAVDALVVGRRNQQQ